MAAASSSSAQSSNLGAVADLEAPWIEKYRPQTLDECVGNSEAIARLRVIAEDGNMPNLIIAGPPGTGKTTSVMALARTLLGSNFREAVLELNASDDRTLDVVRNKIKMFAQKKVTLPAGRHKIVILDEADSMTKDAQQALRRTMEVYSSTTRFALACNNSSDIIEPIQSRCAVLRYQRLSDTDVLSRVMEVIEAEKLQGKYAPDGLEALSFTAEGDLRNALNALQSTVSGFGFISAENVFKVCDQPHPGVVKEIVDGCLAKDWQSAHSKLQHLITAGYSAQDIIGTFFKIVRSHDMPENLQLEFIREIGQVHMRIVEGVQSPLQLSALLARLCTVKTI